MVRKINWDLAKYSLKWKESPVYQLSRKTDNYRVRTKKEQATDKIFQCFIEFRKTIFVQTTRSQLGAKPKATWTPGGGSEASSLSMRMEAGKQHF